MATDPYDDISSVATDEAPADSYESISSPVQQLSKGEDLMRRLGRAEATTFTNVLQGGAQVIGKPVVEGLETFMLGGEKAASAKARREERRKAGTRPIDKLRRIIPALFETDPTKDKNISAKATEFVGSVAPVVMSGPLAPLTAGTSMGGSAIETAEAQDKTPEEIQRSANINAAGGTALGLVPIPFLNRLGIRLDKAVQPIENTLVREGVRRGGRAATGAVLGGTTNALGDVGLQLADTGEIDAKRVLENAAIGAGAGMALSGANRRTTASRRGPTPDPLAVERRPLELARQTEPTAVDFAAEEQAALEMQQRIMDQRTIREQIQEQARAQYTRRSPEGAQALRERLAYEEAQAARNADIEANKAQIVDPAADLQNTIEQNRLAAPEQVPTETLSDQARRQMADLNAQKSTEIKAELSPQAARMRDEYGRVSTEVIMDPRIRAAGGAVGGAAFGLTQGDTPEERLRNALLYGTGGAVAASVGLGKVFKMLEPTARPPRAIPLPSNARVTVQEYAGLDNVPKKAIQIDLIDENGVNTGSHSPQDLAAQGYDVSKVNDLPQGQYRALDLQEIPSPLSHSSVESPASGVVNESTPQYNATPQGQVQDNNPIQYPQAGGGRIPPEASGGNRVPPSGNVPPEAPQGPIGTPPRVPADLAEAGLGGKFMDLKTNLVDYTAPIETLFRDFQKQYGYEVRPRDRITNMISRAINARSIAGQFLRDSGYFQLLRDVPDLKEFDRYITDVHALDVDTIGGKQTGVDLVRAKANVAANQQLMQPYADRLRDFSRQILSKGVEYGLIPAERAAYWEEKYPNYVPLKRVFEEAEIPTRGAGGGRGVTNLGSQSVFQKMLGSKRPIIDPTGSFITKAEDLFAQGERNRAAQTLASYRTLPGWDSLLQEVESSSNAPHTFTYMEDGVKKTIAAPKEIAEAAKALNVHQLGILGRVLAVPMRIFKAGTTGLEPSFAARNFIKDQFTAAIATRDLPATVKNFVPAVMEAIGHGQQYQELVRQGGIFTSFDVNRAAPETTAQGIRSGRSAKERALYLATNPSELFRAFENVVGRPEEATRIQQFLAQFESDVKKGVPREDALVNAAEAARQVTADFSRHGNFGPVMRAFQPYLTAGFAGSRALVRAFRRDPVMTTAKTAALLLLPEVVSTAWNLSDEKRKEAYADLSPYEKENFFIILPPNPIQDERGRWNAIKIPMPPGYSNFTRFVRRPMEQWAGQDPVSFGEMAQSAIGTVSPIEPNKQGLLSNIALQPVKPMAEIGLNKDFFTGRDIIPADLIDKVPEYQYDKKTSGTSIWLGQQLGISPLQIDHAVKGYLGRGGTELQNMLDRTVARVSGNPDFQVGGRSVTETFERSFGSAQGGQSLNRFYQAHKESTSALNTYNKLLDESRDVEAEQFYNNNQLRIEAGVDMEAKRKMLQDLTQEMRAADEEGDLERVKELRQEKTDLAKEAITDYRLQTSGKSE